MVGTALFIKIKVSVIWLRWQDNEWHVLERFSSPIIQMKSFEASFIWKVSLPVSAFFFFLEIGVYLFIYLFIYLFLAVLGLCFCVRAFSSCGKRGPLFIAVRGPLTVAASLVVEHKLQSAGSVVVAHGPSCSAACGILPGQGSNPCPLPWQAESQPLRHQGSPISAFDNWNALIC